MIVPRSHGPGPGGQSRPAVKIFPTSVNGVWQSSTASGGRTSKTLSAIAAVITALGAKLPLAGTPGSPITTGR